MDYVRTVAKIAALTLVAVTVTSGIAGAAGGSKGDAPSVTGTVTSVNGTDDPGTCGSGTTGSFVLARTKSSGVASATTVDVSGTTSYVEKKVADPTFANVCVGDKVTAIGSNTDFTMSADAVSIHVPPSLHVFGLVTAVDGVTTSGTCGSAGALGTFLLATESSSGVVDDTVDVAPTTVFLEARTTDPTFADLCVGDNAKAVGPATDGTVAASLVTIKVPKPPKPIHVKGDVTAVDGLTVSGSCGVTGDPGSFVVTWTDHHTHPATTVDTTVDVTASTPFAETGGTPTSFADVCVGSRVAVIGPSSSGTLDADAVAVYPASS